MPRKAVEAAAIAPEPPAAAPKSFSRAALDAAAKALVAKRKAAHDAARWCVENGKGAKAAVKSGLFGDAKVVTRNVIEPLRKQLTDTRKFNVDDRDHHNQILTNVEREKLATWILGCADGQKPKDRVAISLKVRELLKARHAANKQRRWRAGCKAGCTCGLVPCPWAGWKRCPACGPKKGLCKVRACKAARDPLLLGYNPPVGLLEGPAGDA